VRVLITGANGQLGHELVATFEAEPHHEVIATTRATLDLTSRDRCLAAICGTRPDAVIHAAAWTAVDACEGDPEQAFTVNAMGTRHVAEAARRVGAPVFYVSTDYVFDGTKSAPYIEWDQPNPQSVYGASKLAGERELTAADTVIRTSWVCGAHGANMVKTILRLAAEHDTLRFVDDQVGHPSFAADLAVAIKALVVDHRPGTFHLTNAGAVSWYAFAREVLIASGSNPDRVQPVSTADLQPARPAPRPANSVLDNAAWRMAGLTPLRDFREPLREVVGQVTSC
jgi:dTDP-4-dehydrorhamnose reductase